MKIFLTRFGRTLGWPGLIIIGACSILTWLIGCATNKPAAEVATSATPKGGAQLWAENCVRCHNIRSPGNYSPAQWEVVMMHMRVRANLTADEHKKVLEFLKAGS